MASTLKISSIEVDKELNRYEIHIVVYDNNGKEQAREIITMWEDKPITKEMGRQILDLMSKNVLSEIQVTDAFRVEYDEPNKARF